MAYITIEDLQDYTGTIPETLSNNELDPIAKNQEMFVGAAMEIVKNYLGYDPETKYTTDFPILIKMTALRIAALLQTEAGGDIGITSKSFGMEGSRSFLNYTSYEKYLLPISAYRIIR